jgi:hypothetical protein
MRDYAFSDVGILLNGLVPDDVLDELSEDETCEAQFSFTGEAFPLHTDGREDWGHGDSFSDATVYYLASRRHSTLFKAAYKNMTELVTAMLAQYEAARRSDSRLPELTPRQVRKRLRAIQGTYYG